MIRKSYRAVLQAEFAIRPLELADLAAVREIELQSYSHPWSEAVFRDCFRADYRLWAFCPVAGSEERHEQSHEQSDDEILGGYAVVAYLFDEAHLLNLCVAPGFRRMGAGRQLLRHLIAQAAHDRMKQTILEVRASNLEAAALYESEGFRVIGQRPGYYPAVKGREDAVVMALDLSVA